MEKKELVINSSSCDTRKVSEATLEQYEAIRINAAMVLTNARSQELLNKYHVRMNCANVVNLEDGDVQLRTVNGSAQIKSTDVCDGKFYYIVNGRLEIGPGTEKVMENCVGMQVNGCVMYPESMSGKLGNLTVNGSATCYPDDAILLKNHAVIDRTFVLRAKKSLYWTAGRLVMVDPNLDPAKLAEKGAAFSGKKAILTEGNAEALVPLIDERTELTIVPDGTVVIRDDVQLDASLVKARGGKLYIFGDVTVGQDSGAALDAVEYLNVRGDVRVAEPLRDQLLAVAEEISGDVRVIKGREISDKIKVKITRWMLEQEADGISVVDCVNVMVDPDVPNELILRRLRVRDCVSVECTPEQEGVMGLVCEDVASLGSSGGEMGAGAIADAVKDALSTNAVNASEYVM